MLCTQGRGQSARVYQGTVLLALMSHSISAASQPVQPTSLCCKPHNMCVRFKGVDLLPQRQQAVYPHPVTLISCVGLYWCLICVGHLGLMQYKYTNSCIFHVSCIVYGGSVFEEPPWRNLSQTSLDTRSLFHLCSTLQQP